MTISKHQSAILALIIANIIWGAASPIFKWSLENVPLYQLAFLRFFLPAVFFFIINPQKTIIAVKDIPLFILLGLIMFLHITFYFWGLKFAPSINAPIIASSGPILLILLSMRFLHEHPKHKIIFGTLLSLIGVLIITLRPFLEQNRVASEVLGNTFIIAATILVVVHALLAKRILTRYPAMTVTWWYFLIAGILFAPFFMHEATTVGLLPSLDIRGIVGITFGVLFASILAHSFYIWGIGKIAASEIGIFSYIDPVAAIIIAVPLLGETVTVPFLIGSALVFLGIFIAESRIHWHPLHRLKGNR